MEKYRKIINSSLRLRENLRKWNSLKLILLKNLHILLSIFEFSFRIFLCKFINTHITWPHLSLFSLSNIIFRPQLKRITNIRNIIYFRLSKLPRTFKNMSLNIYRK